MTELEQAQKELEQLLHEKNNPHKFPPYDCVVDENGILIGCRNKLIPIPKIDRPVKEKIKLEKVIPRNYKLDEWVTENSFCRLCQNERIVCGGELKCKYNTLQ